MDGVKIRDSRILARDIQTDEMVVSFLALPIYMEDKEIHEKLRGESSLQDKEEDVARHGHC